MSRPASAGTLGRTLGLWSNGERVGRWTLWPSGDTELQYDPVWMVSGTGRPISLSLPFPKDGAPLQGPRVAHWFDNLLPESTTRRKRLAERFATGTDAFDLLHAIGRDCAGALQLLPDDETPSGVDRIEGVTLKDTDVERHLLEVALDAGPGTRRGANDDFRFALSGMQAKTALLRWSGRWFKPRGSTPSTHILKLPLGLVGSRRADFSGSVDNEWLCLQLLRAYGLEVPNAEILTFGSQRVLAVERFDRIVSRDGRRLLRRVQEDFCQATATPSRNKYEHQGGPDLETLFRLTEQSIERERDLRTLMAAQILFWMLRAPDGHAKNFSLHLMPGSSGRFRLAPLYDVMSALPVMGQAADQWRWEELKLALSVSGRHPHFAMHGIRRRHFNATAKKLGFGPDAEVLVQDLVERTPAVVAQVQAQLPAGFSQKVADRIFNGVLESARTLGAMPAN